MTVNRKLVSETLLDGLGYPEGIRWHRGRLWFCDFVARSVYTYDPVGGDLALFRKIDGIPSGLGFLPDGTPMVADMKNRKLLLLECDRTTTLKDFGGDCEMLNDMIVDAQGRAYLNAYFSEDRGGIIRVDRDGKFQIVDGELNRPNGMAITHDGLQLVANDMQANLILSYDITSDGGLTNKQVFADLGASSPDGLCLDAAGAAWVGFPFDHCFRRIARGGGITAEIPCAPRWGVAPVLGGGDRRTLFLCTALLPGNSNGRQTGEATRAETPPQGWIEVVRDIEIAGAGLP